MVKLVMGLHHENPLMMKLEVELHQGCYIKKPEVSRGGEVSDRGFTTKNARR